jgi:hypothetical protein
MDLSEFEHMDPHLLVGVVNTLLRNQCEDLEDLCRLHDLDPVRLCAVLSAGGYDYREEVKAFR